MSDHRNPGLSPERLVGEQIAYYKARAGEYDEWFLRRGRYDRGSDANQAWFGEIREVEAALVTFRPAGRVLELACGTGLWTRHLIRFADSVTAVDASSEALALNRERMGSVSIDYIEADIFNWRPVGLYDVVFFSFWLSHVPPERFEPFWEMVLSCLAPGGRVFFIDSRYDETSTARHHRLESRTATTVTRRLNDRSEYRIVKVFYEPVELTARLDALGWGVTVRSTPHFFLYGHGSRKPT